jgi:tyrosine-protein phosphatase YwqE
VDDGPRELAESLEIVRGLVARGYETLWLTPHIKEERFAKTREGVREALADFAAAVKGEGIEVELGVAAEYYVGPKFLKFLESGEQMLTLGENYVLIEFSMHQEPVYALDVIYEMAGRGLVPVLAHPERYEYWHGQPEVFARMRKQGCMMQINLFSLAGYYGRGERLMAERLLRERLCDFAATDIHHASQLATLDDARIANAAGGYDFKNGLLAAGRTR